MKELLEIREAVVAALKAAGLTAVTAYRPGRMKRYAGAVAAVDVAEAEGSAMGFCNYLGETFDEQAGTVREVYGKQLRAVISVEVRAERAADGETGCEQASQVLLAGLPAGIRSGTLTWSAAEWDAQAGMFLRRGRLHCCAVFTAETGEDRQGFLDFHLKGVVMT